MQVCENRVLRRIFGPKRDELTRDCVKLRNEEFHNLYSWPNIIIMIKSRRIKWTVHVAHMEEMRKAYRTSVGKTEKAHFEDIGVSGRVILKWILEIGCDGVD
jgi:hypothetical protein